MLKKCSSNKRLKSFLINHPNHFTIDKKDNVSIKPSSQFSNKNDAKMSSTAENTKHANKVPSSLAPDSEVSIIIHFTYTKRFHKTIPYKDIESFKVAVFQILSDKITTCKPVDIEYQVGSEWYLLEEAEALDDILTGSKREIYMRATPQQCNPQSNMQTASSQSGSEPSPNQGTVSAINEHYSDAESISNPASHETAEEIRKKGILTDVLNVSISHLQRSLAIMIKSIMSRLYGTKDTLKKLSLLTQALNIERSKIKSSGRQGSKNMDKTISDDITRTIETKCVLWESSQSNDWSSEDFEDWLYHFKKALPRKNKKVLDEDVQAISEENFMFQPADKYLKFIERASHKGTYIFSSMHINFKTHSFEYINFKKLATSVLNIRHFYRHEHKYEQMAKRYQKDISEVTEMCQEIISWAKKEDGNEEIIAIMEDDLEHIKHKREGHEIKSSVKSSQVLTYLLNLNFNHYGYMLFSALNAKEIDISHSQLQYLSYIPWSAVIDFDVHSKHSGLFSAMCEFDEINHCVETKYLSPKKYIKSFSYANLNHVERVDLTKPGHMPWLFPHGDVDDESNNACPLNDHKKYIQEVRKPVCKAVRAIASRITEQKPGKSEAIVNLVLCYGDFAYKSKNLPHAQFLDDFLYLCNFLLTDFESVVVLTDNEEICLLFKTMPEIKVFKIPLSVFCQVVSDLLVVKDIPPIKLPTQYGLREIKFVEEDFELVHKDIAEHEMHKFIIQKQTENRQNADIIAETGIKIDEHYLRHKVIKELRIKFYKCETVSFISLDNNDIITREEESEIMVHLRGLLDERMSQKTEPATYVLYHTTGAGATTLSRKIVWQLRTEYPCVILKSDYKYSDKKIRDTSQTLKNIHKEVNLPILMLIDEEPSFQIVPQLTKRVQIDGIPMVFLHIQRYTKEKHHIQRRKSTDSYHLSSYLRKKDAYNFQEKLCIAFGEEKISAGYKKMDEITASMIIPKVGDKVQDSIDQQVPRCYGTIIKKEYQSNFYEVEIKWDNKHHTQLCMIGTTKNFRYKRVYIKDISNRTMQLFKTFHLYGIMCLNEEFRIPMKNHVKCCLQTISSKKELCMLAHLSILFAFKVVEVLPSRSFQQLCCKIMQQTQTKDFDLMMLISDPAKEFAMVDALGQFRIVHSIVAEEILDFFLSSSQITLSELVCEFQEGMIYDSEYRNTDVESAIQCLLYDREVELSADHAVTRKLFSNIILAIEDKEGKDAAIKVFRSALPLIGNHHAYSHLARYLSKKENDFEQALLVIDNAKVLAGDQDSAIAFIESIRGDIYRDQLKHYLNNSSDKKPDWGDPNEYAYQCHRCACEAYQISYKTSPLHFPLNGEIKVRLLLLKSIKDLVNDFTASAFKNSLIAESVEKCFQLFKKLEEFIKYGDGGKGSDSDSRQTSVTVLKAEFYSIVEHDSEKQKQTLQNFINSAVKSENKVPCRRWFVELCLPHKQLIHGKTNPRSCHTSPDYYYLLSLLEDNLSVVGHNDTDMKLWLSIVRKLPGRGNDMEKIKDKLLKWKSKSSSVDGNSTLVNFYLTIFYFIKLISCDKTEAPVIISNFNAANERVQKDSMEDKSRSRIREWLQAAGEGFQCLRSDQQDTKAMRWLEGKFIILSRQESPLISWKGIHVFADHKMSMTFKDGQHVKFTVGFSLRGVRAITIEPSSKNVTPDSATMQAVFTF